MSMYVLSHPAACVAVILMCFAMWRISSVAGFPTAPHIPTAFNTLLACTNKDEPIFTVVPV